MPMIGHCPWSSLRQAASLISTLQRRRRSLKFLTIVEQQISGLPSQDSSRLERIWRSLDLVFCTRSDQRTYFTVSMRRSIGSHGSSDQKDKRRPKFLPRQRILSSLRYRT